MDIPYRLSSTVRRNAHTDSDLLPPNSEWNPPPAPPPPLPPPTRRAVPWLRSWSSSSPKLGRRPGSHPRRLPRLGAAVVVVVVVAVVVEVVQVVGLLVLIPVGRPRASYRSCEVGTMSSEHPG